MSEEHAPDDQKTINPSNLNPGQNTDWYELTEVSKREWPSNLAPEPPPVITEFDLARSGLILLASREDPTAFAAQLARRNGQHKWLTAPSPAAEVDLITKSEIEIADAWLLAANGNQERLLLCKSVDLEDAFKLKKLGDPLKLEQLSDRLANDKLTVLLPVHMKALAPLSDWLSDRRERSSLKIAVLPWAHLFVVKAAEDKGSNPDIGLADAISRLPAYLRDVGKEPPGEQALAADGKLYEALSTTIEKGRKWQETALALAKQIDEFQKLSLEQFLENQDEEGIKRRQNCLTTLASVLSPTREVARDELCAAMLLVVAFGDKMPPDAFRNTVCSVLPPDPVLSLTQLPYELRNAWEREDKARMAMKQGRAPLPTWDQVLDTRAFDEAMATAEIIADGEYVRLGSSYNGIDLQGEIGSRYTGLIESALTAVARRAAILEPANRHFLTLVEMFARIEARFPRRINRALMIAALTSLPADPRIEMSKQALRQTSADAIGAGASPEEVADFENQHAIKLHEYEEERRNKLDEIASQRFGPIIVQLFKLSPPSADRDGFADQIFENLSDDWVTERVTVLMRGLLAAMFKTSEAPVDRIWRLLGHLFQRVKHTSESAKRGPGIHEIVKELHKLFCSTSAENTRYVRTWLLACRKRCEDDLSWDGIQTLAYESMAEVGIRWISRPFNYAKRRDYLALTLLGQEGERPESVDTIKSFVTRFFGDPALERVRALERTIGGAAGVDARLADVFWVLMDGIPQGEIRLSDPLARLLFEIFERELRLDGFSKTRNLKDLAIEVVEAAKNARRSDASARQGLESAARLAELFRAAALAHWRFEMVGVEPLRRGEPVSVRLGQLLSLIVAVSDRWPKLAAALDRLAGLQLTFCYAMQSRGERALAELFANKAHVITELARHIRKRGLSEGKTDHVQRSRLDLLAGSPGE